MTRIGPAKWCGIFALVLAVLAVFAQGPANAVVPDYPDPDTEKHCESAGENPECAAKTFVACSEKTVATCQSIGLNVQPDGTQYKADETAADEAWIKPWTLPWTELLHVTRPEYPVWEIAGLRDVVPARLRGVARRSLAGTHEMMIRKVDAKGTEEKESIFLAQRKGAWVVTGFARWRSGSFLNTCERRKLGSLACRYTVNGLSPWQADAPISPP